MQRGGGGGGGHCKVCNDLGVCYALHTIARRALPGLHKCQRVRTEEWIFILLRLGVEPRPLDLRSTALADSPIHGTPASCQRHQMSERNGWLLFLNAHSTLQVVSGRCRKVTRRSGVADDDDVELNVLGCRVDILGTNCDQCVCTVQCCFTSTETIRLIRTGSPGRPPRLSHSS